MSHRHRSFAVLLAVPALALGACGGSSDSDKIKSLVKSVSKDSAAACAHLTAKLLKQFGGSQAACEAGLRGYPSGAVKGDIKVSVNGDNATADFTTTNGKRHVTFVKQSGDWKIDTISAG